MNCSHLLAAFLAEVWGRPYQVGEWDCVLFITAWADRISGSTTPLRKELMHGYQTEAAGIRRFARNGINVAVHANLIHQGWREMVPAVGFQVGDIVLTDLEHPGIWDGLAIAAQPARSTGLLRLHPRHARLGLRWPGVATEKDVRSSS